MLTNTALYAVKKRKKPVQKIPKPSPPDGAKSNPSKRHRDRLNGELDKLTSLLPFTDEVRARLDKLSVLRLSVGYLKVKNFFNATLKKGQNGSSWSSDRSLMFGGNALTPSSTSSSVTSPCSSQVTSIDGVSFSEGELLLQALNGFVLVVTAEGYVFYASPTIQDFLGFHQSDVVHQSVFELIHTDDRALFRRQLHFALKQMSQQDSSPENPSEQGSSEVTSNLMTYDPQSVPPENSSFLERNFCCRFRCLLDNSSGFLALNFHGRLKFLHGQHHLSDDGTLVPPQLALFTIATPLQPPSILEIRTKTLIFQTKHKLDFTPMGIDSRGKVVLGYSEVELCTRGSGYHFIHAADMMYCADNHLRMMKTGDSGFTVFRLLSKSRTWIWVQASARVVFKGGKPDFIVARQRALTNEEGEEQLRLRRLQLPFNFATGEAMLYDLAPTVDVPADSCSAPKQRKMETNSISHDSILGCMLSQDQSIYCEHNASAINDAAFRDSHATVSVPGDIWKMPSPKSSAGLVKPEATVQDMMETLQQILGDSELSETLDVCPEELKSWESTLLKMGGSGELGSEDLNDFFSHDILSYVEEQLQKDGGLKILDHLDDVAPCLSVMDLQGDPGPGLVPGVEQDFSWHLDSQDQTRPHAAAAGLNGPTLQQIADMAPPMTFDPSLVDSCAQTQNQLRTLRVSGADGGDLGVFPVQNHLRQPADVQLNSVFHFQGNRGNQWNADVFNQNLPAAAGFVSDPAPSSCLQQNRFQAQNSSETQNPSWSPLMSNGHQPAGACINQMPGFHRNPQNSMFRTAETSQFQQVQQGLEQPPPSSCMFRNAAAPSAPVNGVQLGQPPSCPRLNPAAAQVPTKPSCFYQGLPGVGGVPGLNAAAVPDPEAAQLSCQMTGGLDPDGLMPYLDFTEQTQITSCPVVGNGGFPSSSSSLANGNAFYSEKQIGISHCESWTANDATLGLKHQFKGN